MSPSSVCRSGLNSDTRSALKSTNTTQCHPSRTKHSTPHLSQRSRYQPVRSVRVGAPRDLSRANSTPRFSYLAAGTQDEVTGRRIPGRPREDLQEEAMMDDLDLGFSPEELEGPLVEDIEAFFFEDAPKQEITAEPGSVEERVQRVLSGQPKDWFNPDYELSQLTEGIMDGAGNRYALALEVSIRAHEVEMTQMEFPGMPLDSSKPIIGAICEMALEMEAAGGRMSAGLAEESAMARSARLSLAADRSFLDEISATDVEMLALGVDPNDQELLPIGRRIAGFGDIEGEW